MKTSEERLNAAINRILRTWALIKMVPEHRLSMLRRFFQDYKVLENKNVVVDDLLGPADAVKIILDSMDLYGKLRRGELHE